MSFLGDSAQPANWPRSWEEEESLEEESEGFQVQSGRCRPRQVPLGLEEDPVRVY